MTAKRVKPVAPPAPEPTMGGVPVRRAKERPTFKVGDFVQWSSQAAGSWKTKAGEVAAVIPPGGGKADLMRFGLSNFNSTREHESYVVHVKTPTGKGAGTYYWPVVSGLKRN